MSQLFSTPASSLCCNLLSPCFAACSEDDVPDDTAKPGKGQQHQQQQQEAAGRHQQQQNGSSSSGAVWPQPSYYSMSKREPLYAAAETSCWWELRILAAHSHPSVAAFSRMLLGGSFIIYNGDPLRDFTLPVFLEKFVAKKPKAASAVKGSSVMQPLGAVQGEEEGVGGGGLAELGSEAFAALAEVQVEPSEIFFHR